MILHIPPKIKQAFPIKNKGTILFYGFLCFYVAIMLFLCQKLIIEEDEAYSLTTTSFSFSKIVHLSYFFEGQPPIYFLILSLWRNINESIFFARLLSVIFSLFSAFALHKLIESFYSKNLAKWLVVIFLINPYTVWASQEIRLYSLLIFLTLSITLLFYQIYFQEKKKYIAFIICGLLGIYTQYYFSFIIAAFSIVVLYRNGWKSFWNYCLLALPIVVLSLPNLFCLKEQFNLHENTIVEYTISSRLRSIILTPQEFILSITKTPFDRYGRWIIRFFFVSFIVWSIIKFNKVKTNKGLLDVYKRLTDNLIIIAFQLIVFSLIFIFSDLFYYDRYTTIIFPFYCILFAYFGYLNNITRNFVFISFVIYYLIILLNFYKPPFLKYDDQKSIASFAQQIEIQNEPIVFYDKSLVLRFNQYYNGNNPIISLPELNLNLNFFSENFKDTLELKQAINQKLNNSNHFLIITGNNLFHQNNNDLTDEIADEYFYKYYKVTLDSIFQGKEEIYDLRIRRLERITLP